MAWKLKLKGITIYRAGSRHNVVLTLKDTSMDPYEKNVTVPCNPQQAFPE